MVQLETKLVEAKSKVSTSKPSLINNQTTYKNLMKERKQRTTLESNLVGKEGVIKVLEQPLSEMKQSITRIETKLQSVTLTKNNEMVKKTTAHQLIAKRKNYFRIK